MSASFSPSINLIRDLDRDFDYIPTPNSHRIYQQIITDFKVGIHSFNIIGSYGTGKSAFLVAFEKTLRGDKVFFEPLNGEVNGVSKFQFLNFIGEYSPLTEYFAKALKIRKPSAQANLILEHLLARYHQVQKTNQGLVIIIDEFGKFLEYAAQNNPESELYFFQQLAEFVSDKNILLITTLHQGFDSYSRSLDREQRQEWEKVKGRLKELTFNEPVEQLLALAAVQIKGDYKEKTSERFDELLQLLDSSGVFPLRNKLTEELASNLLPIEILAASVLTQALQKYGQNKRSLFIFLKSKDYLGINNFDPKKNPYFNLSNVYDYLVHNFYSFLSTRYNPDYTQWAAIRNAVERVESIFDTEITAAVKLIKCIGLLNIFSPEGANIDSHFLKLYGEIILRIKNIEKLLGKLESRKIIRFRDFKKSYILFEGTDLDISLAILQASNKVEAIQSIISPLKKYFHFPYALAKAVTYEYGTPRFFKFELSEAPIDKTATAEVDGLVNLIFSEKLTIEELVDFSRQMNECIIFAWFQNTAKIKEILLEIRKIEYVLNSTMDDHVAKRELSSILLHQIEELNDEVWHRLYSGSSDVTWVACGEKVSIKSRSDFNVLLSRVSKGIYNSTPLFRNELINKHKLSSSISAARKMFFEALLNNWKQEDIGFPKEKFPAEKTIYFTLLKKTGIHRQVSGGYVLGPPSEKSFKELWQRSEGFLNGARVGRKSLDDFLELLSTKPLKLKRGFIDFWMPLFLFIRRDDFALFGENGYLPFITAEIVGLIIKKPQAFKIKTFDVSGIRLDLFNKYRMLLNQKTDTNFSNRAFVDTIRPFLTFYKELSSYTRNTQRLSKASIALRDAISSATDPEETFFDTFPKALGYTHLELNDKNSSLEDFVYQLQSSLRELRSCYDDLIDRIERHFLKELQLTQTNFDQYKRKIQQRYRALKKYLLLPYQKTFYIRLNAKLDDRKAWINSLVHALVGKNLDSLRDEEEPLLFEKFTSIFQELDNLYEMSKIKLDPSIEDIVMLEITSLKKGTRKYTSRLLKNVNGEVKLMEKKLEESLSKDKKLNIAVLSKLLGKELDK